MLRRRGWPAVAAAQVKLIWAAPGRAGQRAARTDARPAAGGRERPARRTERLQHLLDVALVCNFLGQIRLSQADHDRAAQLFTEALNAARSAQDRFTILVSLYDLALSSQARGDLTGAAERLQEGVSQSAEARDEPSVAYYLEALAAVAIQQDNLERAVHLLAAAGALLQAKGSGWLHALVPRAAHDDGLLAALRSRMGDAAFERAWTRGQSLGGSRAVEYALAEDRKSVV